MIVKLTKIEAEKTLSRHYESSPLAEQAGYSAVLVTIEMEETPVQPDNLSMPLGADLVLIRMADEVQPSNKIAHIKELRELFRNNTNNQTIGLAAAKWIVESWLHLKKVNINKE